MSAGNATGHTCKECSRQATRKLRDQWLCGIHAQPVVKYINELDRYRKYQEKAFGAVIYGWTDTELRERKTEIEGVKQDGLAELSSVRLAAELTAINGEIARQRDKSA
jgi:hypothetical protein